MRDFLLDTQMIRYWYDADCPQHIVVVENLALLREQAKPLQHKPKLLVSVITLGEIEFGHRVQSGDFATQQSVYLRFVQGQLPAPLEIMRDVIIAYGEIRSRLFNKYAPGEKRKAKKRPEQLFDPSTSLELQIQENDLWLCAQAVTHGLVLVTNDRMRSICSVCENMNFELHTQNWTEPLTAKLE